MPSQSIRSLSRGQQSKSQRKNRLSHPNLANMGHNARYRRVRDQFSDYENMIQPAPGSTMTNNEHFEIILQIFADYWYRVGKGELRASSWR